MGARPMTRYALFAVAVAVAVAALALAACGDDDAAARPPDGGTVVPQPPVQPPADAGSDAAPAARTSCLDAPGLARPPSEDRLPCELIPPGLSL
jgi:hypothetical protein